MKSLKILVVLIFAANTAFGLSVGVRNNNDVTIGAGSTAGYVLPGTRWKQEEGTLIISGEAAEALYKSLKAAEIVTPNILTLNGKTFDLSLKDQIRMTKENSFATCIASFTEETVGGDVKVKKMVKHSARCELNATEEEVY